MHGGPEKAKKTQAACPADLSQFLFARFRVDHVEIADLINGIQIVELSANTRTAAIRALVNAADWEDEGVSSDTVLTAVEEREAAAQTIVDEGLAMPHAVLDWDGEFRILLGRSRRGIDYGGPDRGFIHLIALIVVGRQRPALHLELLAGMAELLKSSEFRQALVDAPDTTSIELLLLSRSDEAAGNSAVTSGTGMGRRGRRRIGAAPRLSAELARHAILLAKSLSAQAVLLAVDHLDHVPWEPLNKWDEHLLIITTQPADELPVKRDNVHLFDIPHASLSRSDRANLGLLLAASTGLLNERASVVCVTGQAGGKLDCITVNKPGSYLQAMFTAKVTRRSAIIPPAVILRVLSLAIELSAEGREAKAVGAMFVIGDARQVLRHAHQLVLNPFHGYAHHLRSVLDPSLAETIKEFATIDGAFIIQADGTVLSAGTYLVPRAHITGLPQGLGTRHQTAAAMTAQTQAVAICVSQSTGTVTVFRNGTIVFTLERASMTRW